MDSCASIFVMQGLTINNALFNNRGTIKRLPIISQKMSLREVEVHQNAEELTSIPKFSTRSAVKIKLRSKRNKH